MPKFAIGVFTSMGKNKLRYRAYSTYYNPNWEGCRVIEIDAPNGTEAKKKAIDIFKKMDSKVPDVDLTLSVDDIRRIINALEFFKYERLTGSAIDQAEREAIDDLLARLMIYKINSA